MREKKEEAGLRASSRRAQEEGKGAGWAAERASAPEEKEARGTRPPAGWPGKGERRGPGQFLGLG